MNTQLNILQEPGKMPDGQTINIGDVVFAQSGPWCTFAKVKEIDGLLSIKGPGAWCFDVSISHLINQNVTVKKVSATWAYKWCKENNWDRDKSLFNAMCLFKK